MNVAYFRVSKKSETVQDLEAQINAVMDKFELRDKDVLILQERGSAYNLENLKNRFEFLKLLKILFNYDETTVKDLFFMKFRKTEHTLYIWGFERISRNFILSLLFSLLCDLFNVRIFSYKEGEIYKKENEKALEKMLRYFKQSITAFSGEKYSDEISENTKKSVVKRDGVTISYKGKKKWGAKFSDLNGYKINMPIDEIVEMNKEIKRLSKNYKNQYVINKIKINFGIKLSSAYISKQKYLNNT